MSPKHLEIAVPDRHSLRSTASWPRSPADQRRGLVGSAVRTGVAG